MADKQKKQKKQQRLKARQPRGFVDRSAADIRATEAMMEKIKAVYERYGFDPVETPMFEYTDALGKFLPDTDRPNEGVFSLQDDDEQWMSLRYDLTAPLARHFAQNINDLQTPYRTYRAGYVFRNEKPGPGRFRQFMQFDADSVGAPNPGADAEMCMMMADTMEALGIGRGDYVVRVNDRRLLDGIMDARGVTEAQKLSTLRSLDKFDKFGYVGVLQLLTSGRKDESGDFTAGAGLSERVAKELLRLFVPVEILSSPNEPLSVRFGNENVQFDQTLFEFVQGYKADGEQILSEEDVLAGEADWLIPLATLLADPVTATDAGTWGIIRLFQLYQLVRSAGYDSDRIAIDPSCVRGLEYYTGPVYECELTFPVTNEKGETVTFGSVAGGGRYDGLVKRFTGQDIPATGFSIGVSRLMTALKNLGKLEQDTVLAPVVVCVMDRDKEALAGYQQMVHNLRNAGIRAEMYQGNPKQFGKQLQYADRRGSPIAIIQGSDERASGEVQVKDLIEGKRLSEEITDNEEWRASRPAQQVVKLDDLIPTVRAVLAAQKAERDA